MANTQTTVPTFISGQVLEAEQLNNSARTGVPVFANTTTRDAGFGGAGEKTLAEGQLCYLESTNVVQYYDGAAWATLGPAPAASSALTFINGGSVGTGSTFSLPNGSFSATYLNYMLVWDNVRVVTGAQNMLMRLRVSGTDDSSSNYFGFSFTVDGSGNYGGLANNADGWRFGGSGTTEQTSMVGVMYIYNPNVAQYTRFTNATFGANSYLSGGGRHEVSTAYDSCTIYGHTLNAFTTGTYRLYGLADS